MIEAQLKDILEKTFDCAHLEVVNDSHHHANHAGSPGTGQSHFSVLVVTNDFIDLSRVQRHQRVNGAVSSLFECGLHALSLNLKTTDEYNCRL